MPPSNHCVSPSLLGANRLSGLGKLAFACLWLMVFAIPWQNALVISSVGTIARLIGLMAGVVCILAIIERARISFPTVGHVLMTLFVLWTTATCLWSFNPDQTVVAAVSWFQLLVMVWLIREIAPRDPEQRRLMQAYVLGTYVSGADTLYRYFFRLQFEPTDRYVSKGFNANDLAIVMALSIPLSYYLATESKGLMVLVYRLQLVLVGTTILLTASRGGLLASLVALAVVPWTFARLTRFQKTAIVLTVAALVCSGLFFVPATSWERLSTISKEFTRGTLGDRPMIWQAGWDVFRVHPFRGVGAGAFRDAHTLTVAWVAHNTFLSILVEEGVIGFGLFFALMVFLAVCALEMPPLEQKLWIITLGTWAVGASSGSWELGKPTWFLFGLLMARWADVARGRRTGSRASHFCAHRLRLLPESRP